MLPEPAGSPQEGSPPEKKLVLPLWTKETGQRSESSRALAQHGGKFLCPSPAPLRGPDSYGDEGSDALRVSVVAEGRGWSGLERERARALGVRGDFCFRFWSLTLLLPESPAFPEGVRLAEMGKGPGL